MKKLLLSLIGILLCTVSFSQSFIGEKKKEIFKQFKKDAVEIGKPEKISDVGYSVKVTFKESVNWYTFTNDDICFFYVVTQKYNSELFNIYTKTYNDKYLKVSEKNTEIVWKEPKSDTFIYRWLLVNLNTNVLYIVFLTKENYDLNKYRYLQQLLGS